MKKTLIFLLLIQITANTFSQSKTEKNKLDSLKIKLNTFLRSSHSYSNDTSIVNTYSQLSKALLFSNLDSAAYYNEKSLELAIKIDWEKAMGDIYFSKAQILASKNEIMNSIDFCFKSLIIFEKQKDKLKIGNAYKALGDLYSLIGDYEKAINFNIKSLSIFRQINRNDLYLAGLNNLGLAYHDSQNYKKAEEIFENALKLNNTLKYFNTYVYVNLAITKLKLGKINESKSINEKLLLTENPNNPIYDYDKAVLLITLADANFKSGNAMKSIKYLDQSEKIIQKLKGNNDLILTHAEVAYPIYASINEKAKEAEYLRKYAENKDLKSKQDLKKRIESLQFEYDNNLQKNEITNLKYNRLLLILLAALITMIVLILIYYYRKLNIKTLIIGEQKGEIDLINQNLEKTVNIRTQELSEANKELITKNFEITEALYKGQTIERRRVAAELHDNLGGTISALKWRLEALNASDLPAKEQKIYTSIKEMIGSAYQEVRHISHNLMPQALEKHGFVGAIENLISEINSAGKLQITFLKPKNFKILDPKLSFELYNISLELVNNILKHSQATKAEIEITQSNSQIKLSFKDNGIGISSADSGGMGLKNLESRVHGLGGEMSISRDEDWRMGVEVRIIVESLKFSF